MSLQADRPILLVTATPGGGKTALVVKIMKEAAEAGRPLFVMGIPELKLPHFSTPPIPEWTELRPDPDHPDLMLPYFTFPDNSLVVLDEAQRVFRIRSAASKIPDHVAAFETVRHTGVTFVLITQHPNFIDTHIRNLVGQHIHLRDVGLLGRWYYEWPECSDPKSFQSAPIKKRYKLPKEVFPLYKSASTHIKRNYTMPPGMLFLAFAAVAIVVGGWSLYKSIKGKTQPAQIEAQSDSEKGPSKPKETMVADAVSSPWDDDPRMQFIPRVPHLPETAPAYDALRVIKTMPQVTYCLDMPRGCRCYTQQGTLVPMDDGQCRDNINNPQFNPYAEPEPVQLAVAGQDQTAEVTRPADPDRHPPDSNH